MLSHTVVEDGDLVPEERDDGLLAAVGQEPVLERVVVRLEHPGAQRVHQVLAHGRQLALELLRAGLVRRIVG